MSRLIGSTLRETPAGTETLGNQMLLRAGFIRQLGQGIYSYLPLAWRVMGKIEQILREEMDSSGGVEISMPVTNPAEIWQRSGRYQAIGPELARFTDRRDRPMVLAMTHEEVVASLAASEINSWRQLPKLVYQIQIKFRDDPRPRAGLIRTREFTMKDAYTLDRDEAGLDRQYTRLYEAYTEIFRRCELPAIAVASDVGMMGGTEAHEFMYLNSIGEDTIVLCDSCGYAKNRQVAQSARPVTNPEDPLPLERVETPEADTIEKLARLVGVPEDRTAKAVFMATSDDRFVIAVVRGDMQLNETKLANAVSASELRPMTPQEILSIGCVPGYASPIGMGGRAIVAVDDLVSESPNLVSGANEAGWHLKNVNVHRDYEPDFVADLVAVEDGQPCIVCRLPLRSERAVEVGNIFKLGTKYSDAMNAKFLDEDGSEKPIVMGSYGIGVGRLLACVAEQHSDDRGLVWPASIAPYTVHICALGEDGLSMSEGVAEALEAAGIDYLLDDRQERAGVQFADAELIGCPIQLTVSTRSLAQGGVEARARVDTGKSGQIVSTDELVAWIESRIWL